MQQILIQNLVESVAKHFQCSLCYTVINLQSGICFLVKELSLILRWVFDKVIVVCFIPKYFFRHDILNYWLWLNSCFSWIHNLIRFWMVSLAVCWNILHVIAVTHEKCVCRVVLSWVRVITHIHSIFCWTEPARRRTIIRLRNLKLIFITLSCELLQTANSCWTPIFGMRITVGTIFTVSNSPVICDVEISTFNDYIYRWHCNIKICLESLGRFI